MSRILIIMASLVAGTAMAQTVPSVSAPISPYTQEPASEGALTTGPPDLMTDEKGFLSYIDFNVNTNESGHMVSSGFSAGYQFNRHLSVDAHLPFYYVSASTTTTDSTGATQTTKSTENGVGDPSFSLLLRLPHESVDFKTRLTTWVPVADINSGFSTGSVLVDWTTQFRRSAGRLLPYGQVGIANTVPESPLFLLPYTAEGFNARFEVGTHLLLSKMFSTGASFYYVLPSGSQTLYSRQYHGTNAGSGGIGGPAGPLDARRVSSNGFGSGNGGDTGNGGSGGGSGGGTGSGSGSGDRFGFVTQSVTEGNDITRDYGPSAWVTANLPYFIDAQFGFSRSFDYDLNTFSFGLGFDIVRAFRHRMK